MLRAVALGLASLGAIGFAHVAGLAPPVFAGGGEKAVPIPASTTDVAPAPGDQVAVLAGGCFWGMEAVFEQVKGVKTVTSGYAGGTRATATYAQVVTERTDHAEAIRITYDPRVVSYATLLRIYFSVAHDPTQLNRQGPDIGPSYRSAIFPQNPGQARVARAYIDQLGKSGVYRARIVTKIESGEYYLAEPEHQDFARRNPNHSYIVRWDKPKVAAFRAAFPSLAR
ncbi:MULTISPECIES: peptide-methionine (S)-S-oxide reductase MsrA [unclassified Sphingomonas]|uniref:peptide-methionine (S)-S-oxide reductase MsrA n=1 Tax=unclassified Sphingomonas TaxID=196159 RepID=UPI002150E5CB|nr:MULTISPECIES: peptide-methionine (S)-S-oxide reductase MsrA [unclassified Sphingomonas]MCR5870391.1 peptide-methionine (S)-S-oxide reductase MsrA [Sphingomonas sp. J344]UUY01269.1 peptide-methionine (S)-S-oxide reductase MsrA [Sphingomonas sp. J315]